MEIPAFLTELNESEQYLKKFLNTYPEYSIKILSPSMENAEANYARLMALMETEWEKAFPRTSFFLKGTSYHLNEDFFLSAEENVTVRSNLRYMPVILHSHQFIELNYVLKSEGSHMIIENENFQLEDGDIILCPPGLVHSLKAHNNKSIIIDYFIRVTTFDTVFFQLLNGNNYLSSLFTRALYTTDNSYIKWHCPFDQNLKKILLDSVYECRDAKKYCNRMMEIMIMQFFLLLMRHHETEATFSSPRINNNSQLFHTLYNYMASHCQNITLNMLASQFNYSERQIIRLLKKNSGKGFSELLLDIRMNRALNLVKNTSLSIFQISTQLGYSSVKYFRKVFIKTFSFSPEEFQERIAQQHNSLIK